MLDDTFYGAVALAGRMGWPLGYVLEMPFKEALTWDVAIQRASVEKHDWIR